MPNRVWYQLRIILCRYIFNVQWNVTSSKLYKKRYAMNRDGSLVGTDVSAHIEGVIRQ